MPLWPLPAQRIRKSIPASAGTVVARTTADPNPASPWVARIRTKASAHHTTNPRLEAAQKSRKVRYPLRTEHLAITTTLTASPTTATAEDAASEVVTRASMTAFCLGEDGALLKHGNVELPSEDRTTRQSITSSRLYARPKKMKKSRNAGTTTELSTTSCPGRVGDTVIIVSPGRARSELRERRHPSL